MKRFPMLNVLLQLFIALTIGLLEKICILLYLMLPMGLFMLLMSLRTKNHKATAIGTFTNEKSEFQHIFPNYILVVVEPQLLRRSIAKRVNEINSFIGKYLGMILVGSILILLILGAVYYLHKVGII
jgi:hypothetical protein